MSPAEWEDPGIYEVAPDVYRISLPLPGDALRCVNVYALAESGRLVLIDAGWALDASFRQLALALAQIGCTAADVREFLITHVHRDHYTQAVAIRRRFGTAIALGDGERPSIEVVTGRITQAASGKHQIGG